MRLQKRMDGYGDKTWTEWFRYLTREISLNPSVTELLTGATGENLARLWMQNCADNLTMVRQGLKIQDATAMKKPVLVVGAGPSVRNRNQLGTLRDWTNMHPGKIGIITTDKMLAPLLNNYITPDFVMTVDGNRELILPFFDNVAVNSLGRKSVTQGVALSVWGPPNVGEYCLKVGMPVYWFIGQLDSFALRNGITRLVHYMTGAAAIGCGGNAGTGSWALANFCKATEIALIGLDFGYTANTPLEETAYYKTLKEHFKDDYKQIHGFYSDDFNPDFQTKGYTDLMFQHYKIGFMAMLDMSKIPTVNCTEGGILHGGKLKGMMLKDWLKSVE